MLARGPAPADARLTMILMHGRGASADDILALAGEIASADIAYLAPQAADHTWYPYSFLAPIAQNKRGIGSAFGVVSRLIEALHVDGVESRRIGLLGFSQGACLALEYAARHADRYAAVVGPQRRTDWAARHASQLHRVVLGDTRVSGLQR